MSTCKHIIYYICVIMYEAMHAEEEIVPVCYLTNAEEKLNGKKLPRHALLK